MKDHNPKPFNLIKSKTIFRKKINVWEYNDEAAYIITKVKINGLTVRAMWDTGSELTVITNKIADFLNLKSIRENYTRSIDGVKKHSPVHNVELSFSNVKMDIEVTSGYEKISDYFDIIIGLNVFYKGEFSIKISDGKTLFKFKTPIT